MAKHLETGAQGEQLAKEHLLKKGYVLLAQNWRHQHLEIDLIMQDDDTLVFVEVKTRKNDHFGAPYEHVLQDKIRKLARAANEFLASRKYGGEIRFDIVSVIYSGAAQPTMNPDHVQIEHIEDAFWPE